MRNKGQKLQVGTWEILWHFDSIILWLWNIIIKISFHVISFLCNSFLLRFSRHSLRKLNFKGAEIAVQRLQAEAAVCQQIPDSSLFLGPDTSMSLGLPKIFGVFTISYHFNRLARAILSALKLESSWKHSAQPLVFILISWVFSWDSCCQWAVASHSHPWPDPQFQNTTAVMENLCRREKSPE